MARLSGPDQELVYPAAQRWVDSALRSDGSLFTPERKIWTEEWLDDLDRRFVQNPDESGDSFLTKLERQLAGAPSESIQLMAEVLYVHLLIVAPQTIGGDRQRELINTVLSWSADTVEMPSDLARTLDSGLAAGGTAFNTFRPFHLQFLIEFSRRWKRLSGEEKEQLLTDPWQFKAMVWELPLHAAYAQRLALLHLVHPETFEPIVSREMRSRIVAGFGELIQEPTEDVDRQLLQIRTALADEYGAAFNFWDEGIIDKWQPDSSLWGQFIHWARRLSEIPSWEEDEVTYKLDSASKVAEARSALLVGGDWQDHLEEALKGNQQLTPWQLDDRFIKWARANSEQANDALQRLWGEGTNLSERIDGFLGSLPREVSGGPGLGLALASFLLMGVDPHSYPIYRPTPFHKGFDLTEYGRPDAGASPSQVYEHALSFLDRIAEEAAARNLELPDRLNAQGILWSVVKTPIEHFDLPQNERDALRRFRGGEIPEDEDPTAATVVAPATLDALADDLLISAEYLERILRLLEDRKQVILYGPPGTGKTYVARKLAAYIAGDEGTAELVQFHPSYAYEDFVQGYRPAQLESGAAGFKLRDGPLKRIAERAAATPQATHALIIDEINRGNLAKVFGELYFLLEYRRQDIILQYSDERFSLPENLWIIGTMNTADRSIALVDTALRRRFHFIPFYPDEEPIKGLLGRWLAKNKPAMTWVADVVDRANAELGDRQVAIGPSHFLRADLDEDWVDLIWTHSVIPYIAEQFYGEEDRLADFDLVKLRAGEAWLEAESTDSENLGEDGQSVDA